MKNRITTNILRTIKKSLSRFLSLIIMSLLGVMVFVGLLATSPDMLITIDNYYDKNNVYDIKILSSMGLINDDISAIQKINNINNVYDKELLIAKIFTNIYNEDFIKIEQSLPYKK
jgi:putative ABC transport system permease protein